VFSLALHPILDILITGGRDSVARVFRNRNHRYLIGLDWYMQVWDMRTKHQINVLGGHTSAVSSLITSSVDPQIITGSNDSTIKVPLI